MKRGKGEPPKNLPASVKARLLTIARSRNEDFNAILTRYVIERVLHRLASSSHASDFLLKGAMTRLELIFREVCQVPVFEDGLGFDPTTVHAAPIREEAVYDGVRVTFLATLGTARIPVQVDVGFGDSTEPPPEVVELPTLLDHPLWALYGLLLPVLHFFHDFRCVATGRIARHQFPRPRVLLYAFTALMVGLVASVVFQLAHCVEETSFPRPPLPGERLPSAWPVHQVETTVDFAQGNRALSWYLGGLNFQIEHHLFPRICHVHYPTIAPMVRKVCADFEIRYVTHETFTGALKSHFRWIRHLGRSWRWSAS